MKRFFAAVLLSGCVLCAAGVREEFKKGNPDDGNFPVGWTYEGKLPGVPASKVFVRDGVLRLEADQASGGALKVIKNVDLRKTPIIRWRWRAVTLPPGGDGTKTDKDDQAVGIYVALPGIFSRKSVSYHYETETAKGVWGDASYFLGAVKVKFLVVRNKTDRLGEWYTEERDLAADLKKCYGEVPAEFGLSIITNGHNTKSKAAAEVDFIEFVAAPKK